MSAPNEREIAALESRFLVLSAEVGRTGDMFRRATEECELIDSLIRATDAVSYARYELAAFLETDCTDPSGPGGSERRDVDGVATASEQSGAGAELELVEQLREDGDHHG